MDKELMNMFLEKTLAYLNSAEAFLQKNVPAFIEEMLVFDFYVAVFYSIFPVVLVLLFGGITYKCWKEHENKENSCDARECYGGFGSVAMVVTAILLFVSMFVVPGNIITTIKIKTAPRVYLVEKISGMAAKK